MILIYQNPLHAFDAISGFAELRRNRADGIVAGFGLVLRPNGF